VAGEARTALSELTSRASLSCLRKVRVVGRNGYVWKYNFFMSRIGCKRKCPFSRYQKIAPGRSVFGIDPGSLVNKVLGVCNSCFQSLLFADLFIPFLFSRKSQQSTITKSGIFL